MVNEHNENDDVEVETTNDEDIEIEETELEDVEERSSDKIKKMRQKLQTLEDEKKQLQDDLQRAKADFLNARKRLEEARQDDRVRSRMEHVLELLPLCDSFQMAMSDQEAWKKADEAWRKGVEGIHMQLMSILSSYNVKAVDPTGEHFDPMKQEAVGTEEVEDEKLQDSIISVVQRGYEMTTGDKTETIRPARVITGVLNESQSP